MNTSSPNWKGRADDFRAAVFNLAVQRGPRGFTNNEMWARPDLYGRAFRNRVSELHKMGCVFADAKLVRGKWQLGKWDDGEYRYVLVSWPETFKPLPDYYAQKEIRWDERPRVQTDRFGRPLGPVPLPLFAGGHG